jgi:peptidoglycan/LPS O-acetylase OafA/YrhL
MLTNHLILVLVPFVVALGCATLLARMRPSQGPAGRYKSIDGLRGYLAFFVFLHHSMKWFFYVRTGTWDSLQSNFFSHLGEASVIFFFMITGFLFFGKLLDNRAYEIDWLKFFVGRFLRLMPLYGIVVLILLLIVTIQSHGVRSDSFLHIAKCVIQWATFTVFGAPDVNGVNVSILLSGANWTLPYEWYFYLCLPLLSLSVGQRPSWQYLLVGVFALACAATNGARLTFIAIFICGMCAAILVRYPRFCDLAVKPMSSAIVMACLLMLVMFFHTAYGPLQLILLAVAFSLMAGGADLFGILSAKISHSLGEISFSIYLLHGLVISIAFNFFWGGDEVKHMAPAMYWSVIAGLVPILLIISSLTFRYIEYPAMQFTPAVMVWLRQRMHDKSHLDPKSNAVPAPPAGGT